MNDIDELLRDSLQSAPTPQTRVSDPVASVERRATRARALLAGGAVAVAAIVTAAIVVPLSLVDRGSGPSRVQVPPATHAPAPASRQPQVWFTGGSVAMTSGGGSLWHLHRTPSTVKPGLEVDRVDPATHDVLRTYDVQMPADFIAYGLGMAWVWGGGDGGYPDGLLQAVDPTGTKAWSNNGHAFNGVAFLDGKAWATTGSQVWVLDVTHAHGSTSTIVLPGATTQNGIVTTQSGELWVRAGKSWVRIDPTTNQVVDTVQWAGPMLGSAGGNRIWTSDSSRLIAIAPAFLHQGLAQALTTRIVVPGLVQALAPSSNGGLFVVAVDGRDPGNDPTNLYYLSARELAGGHPAIDRGTPHVADVSAYELAPDGQGGVDYAVDAGTHWTP